MNLSPTFRLLAFLTLLSILLPLRPINAFPAVFSVNALNGQNGFSATGQIANGKSGYSVKTAGDLNKDGIDDFVIGSSSKVYVVFGKTTGFPVDIDLSTLNGTNGFTIEAASAPVGFGNSVSGAGDVNGDGIADLLIGSSTAVVAGSQNTGNVYVIYGQTNGFPATMDVSSLDGTNGFMVACYTGIGYIAGFGSVVSDAGDVNKDGFADIIIGAPFSKTDPNVDCSNGRTYVIFGEKEFPPVFDVGQLDGTNGFSATGHLGYLTPEEDWLVTLEELTGSDVAGLGDVNGDGVDDVIIGEAADGQLEYSRCYVIYGRQTPFPADIKLRDLNGSDGFVFIGTNFEDGAGATVGAAGDVNGDGINDILVGVYGFPGFPLGKFGEVCVIFGKPNFGSSFYLNTINGTNGFAVEGDPATVVALGGGKIAGIGDINCDGYADVLMSSLTSSPTASAYVVFGASSFPASISTSALNGINGFKITSKDNVFDWFGYGEGKAGDVNGDGVDDLIIGAWARDAFGLTWVGQSYVILGEAPGVVDVNGDGHVDLFIQRGTTVSAALMNNGVYLGSQKTLVVLPSTSESVVAVNDFNLDGIADLVTQDSNSGKVNIRPGPAYSVSASFTPSLGHRIIGSGNVAGAQVKAGKWGYPDLIARSIIPITPATYYVYTNLGNGSFSGANFVYSSVDIVSNTNNNWLMPVGRYLNPEGPTLPNQYDDALIQKSWQPNIGLYARTIANVQSGAGEQNICSLLNFSLRGAGNFMKATKESEIITIDNATNKVYIGKNFTFSGYIAPPPIKIVGPK